MLQLYPLGDLLLYNWVTLNLFKDARRRSGTF